MAGKVLLVSLHDPPVALRASRALAADGYEVRCARDLEAARMLLLAVRPLEAIVLASVPDDAATTLLQTLALDAELARVPVILVAEEDVLRRSTWAQVRRPYRAANALRVLSRVGAAGML